MHNPDTGELIIDQYQASLAEKCLKCENINEGNHCSKCGTSKIVIKFEEPSQGDASFLDKILGRK